MHGAFPSEEVHAALIELVHCFFYQTKLLHKTEEADAGHSGTGCGPRTQETVPGSVTLSSGHCWHRYVHGAQTCMQATHLGT